MPNKSNEKAACTLFFGVQAAFECADAWTTGSRSAWVWRRNAMQLAKAMPPETFAKSSDSAKVSAGILNAKKQPALHLPQVQAAFLSHEPPFFSEPK